MTSCATSNPVHINVLDHGYVKVIRHYGHDGEIIEAARMSTGGTFRGWDVEDRLLKYLWDNRHTSPFEMADAIFEIKAPIAVFREWHRHRTQSYNEMSARYTPIPNENYVPTIVRLMKHSTTNKQAGKATDRDLTLNDALWWQNRLAATYEACEATYQEGLKLGVPKELARLCMPVGRYSVMRANANLLNWLRFLGLRSDVNPGAQEEIRMYGEAIRQLLRKYFPHTLELFDKKPLV